MGGMTYTVTKIISLKLNIKPLLSRLLTQPLEVTETAKSKIANVWNSVVLDSKFYKVTLLCI